MTYQYQSHIGDESSEKGRRELISPLNGENHPGVNKRSKFRLDKKITNPKIND